MDLWADSPMWALCNYMGLGINLCSFNDLANGFRNISSDVQMALQFICVPLI